MICPSILSADFSMLKEILKELEKVDIKVVHFDVMDNHFVPNLTFGYKFIKDLRKHSKLIFDVHLMINKPEDNIELYLDAGADMITIHYEATTDNDIMKMSKKIRESDKKFGVSIKPNTEIIVLEPLLDYLDMILIMTVEPGFGGQKLIEACVEKVIQLNKLLNNKDKKIIIQVDGGINKSNIKKIMAEGASWIVMGSAFFKEKDFSFWKEII